MRRSASVVAAMLLALASPASAQAPVPGRNVNMVAVDPHLQKQNEPSIAVSTRNPCHLLGGANDYRTVNLPGLPGDQEIGDAWVGLYKSTDCGLTFRAELMPGYPQDQTAVGKAQPVYGFSAGADPYVRPGVAGTFYYSFIVFNRGTNNGKFVVARLIDHNHKEAGDTIGFGGQTVFDNGSMGRLVDKPGIATAVGSGTCTIDGETVPATTVFAAWSVFVGNGDQTIRTKLYFARSSNCAVTLDAPATKVSEGYPLGQGATIGVTADGSTVYVVWRQLNPNGILFVKSIDGGRTFTKAQSIPTFSTLTYYDQGTTPNTFRTLAYPSVTVDHNGRLHVLVSARGYGAAGDSRIVHTSTLDGTSWSPVRAIEDGVENRNGHQIMPAMYYAGGRLNAVWYDLRDDYSQTFRYYIDESESVPKRHTLDVRGGQAIIGADTPSPAFTPYGVLQLGSPAQTVERLSQYLLGTVGPYPNPVQQLQHNPPNMRIYAGGIWPFMGDYIDISGLLFETSRQTAGGPQTWSVSRTLSDSAFHAAWTDNRDVKLAPGNLDVQPYTAPDPQGATLQACVPGQEKTRNANVYTSRIAAGLTLTVPGNSKPANIQRAFSVNVQNGTADTRTVQLSFLSPDGAAASFDQQTSVPSISLDIPPRSTAARTLYVSPSSVPLPRVVVQASAPFVPGSNGGPDLPALSATAIINRDAGNPPLQNPGVPGTSTEPVQSTEVHNPDVANPDVANPDVANPDVANPDVANKNVANPDVANPDVANPDVANPDVANPDAANKNVANPDVANPDVANPDVANPDVANPDVANPDVANPDVANPDVANPDVANSDLENGSLTDVTVEVTNEGNTTSSYQVKTAVTGDTNPFIFQLIGARIYKTPGAKDCKEAFVLNNQILFNTLLPDLGLTFPDPNEPDPRKNPTVLIAPGDTVRITLRVVDLDTQDTTRFCVKVGPDCPVVTNTMYVAVKPQAANTNDPDGEPDVVSNVPAPDLTIDGALVATPSTVVAGDTVTLTGATLRNAGSGLAYVRGGFDTTYYLTPGPATSPDTDPYVAKTSTPSLAPAETLALGRDVVIPDDPAAPLSPGSYRLTVLTDSGRLVAETDETNNSSFAPISIVAAPAIVTSALPEAQAGSSYSQTLHATGGIGSLDWTWAPAGCPIECAFISAIPAGLQLSNGTISGTPTTPGLYGVVVQVADSTPGASGSLRHSDARFLTIAVLGSLVTFTQQPPAAISGAFPIGILVQDASGASIPGALVTLQAADNDLGITMIPTTLNAVSDASGHAAFPTVSVGGTGIGRLMATVTVPVGAGPRGYSNVFTVGSDTTIVGPVGGPGGAEFGPFFCGANGAATAFRGRAGDDIDRTELWCSSLDGTFVGEPAFAGAVGGLGGGDYSAALSCPAGSVITGLHGRAGTLTWGGVAVDTLGVTCRNLASGDFYTSPEVGNSAGAPAFTLDCPAGQQVVGIVGRQGALLDQISIICR